MRRQEVKKEKKASSKSTKNTSSQLVVPAAPHIMKIRPLDKWLAAMLEHEGWEPINDRGAWEVEIYGERYPAVHPAMLHLKLYKESRNPDVKFEHMHRAHDLIWPSEAKNWHHWTERRFRAHCEDWTYIVLAGGGSEAKSYDAAKMGVEWYMANPTGRTVIVMSTTLESLNSRIYGYMLDFVAAMEVDFPLQVHNDNPPRISYRYEDGHKDFKHCIRALSAKQGDTSNTIKNLIGRHPRDGLMVIADEGPDLPIAILEAVPNWETAPWFQLWCIGNSSSKFDLHGSLATPAAGWESIDPTKDFTWPTMRKNGVCLYFNPYDSPAIIEPEPEKRERLSRFLWTEAKLEKAKQDYGEDGEQYWRMVMGFWRSEKTESVVVSSSFIKEYNVEAVSEWAPNQQLELCGGLDIAMSTGGDACLLRLGIVGWDTRDRRVLDFREGKLVYKLEIKPRVDKSAEIQIAEQVLEVCRHFNIPLSRIAIDANGQGRAVGEVVRLVGVTKPGMEKVTQGQGMLKIYSVRKGQHAREAFDVIIKNAYDLWGDLRTYIQNNQIRGLDTTSIQQLTTRKVEIKAGQPKLEDKKDYKNRMKNVMPALAHSPDEADSAALCLQAAILSLGLSVGQTREVQMHGIGGLEAQKLQAAVQAGDFVKVTDRRPAVDGFQFGPGYVADIHTLGNSGLFRRGF